MMQPQPMMQPMGQPQPMMQPMGQPQPMMQPMAQPMPVMQPMMQTTIAYIPIAGYPMPQPACIPPQNYNIP